MKALDAVLASGTPVAWGDVFGACDVFDAYNALALAQGLAR